MLHKDDLFSTRIVFNFKYLKNADSKNGLADGDALFCRVPCGSAESCSTAEIIRMSPNLPTLLGFHGTVPVGLLLSAGHSFIDDPWVQLVIFNSKGAWQISQESKTIYYI